MLRQAQQPCVHCPYFLHFSKKNQSKSREKTIKSREKNQESREKIITLLSENGKLSIGPDKSGH